MELVFSSVLVYRLNDVRLAETMDVLWTLWGDSLSGSCCI